MTYQCPSLPPHVLLTLVFGDTTEPAEGEGLGGGGGEAGVSIFPIYKRIIFLPRQLNLTR